MNDDLAIEPGNYYMDVREFHDGSCEVLLKSIKPMHEHVILSTADPDSYYNTLKAEGISYNSLHGNGLRRVLKDDKEVISEIRKQENHERAVRRAKQNIRFLVKEMGADRLLTLTYRQNEQNREKVKEDFKRFLRFVKKGWKGQGGQPEWKYVAVLEKQDRGAFHIHVAIRGWQRIKFLRAAWYKAIGGSADDSNEKTLGQVDLTSPRKSRWGTGLRDWRSSKLAAYLSKYLLKTFEETDSEKRRYWHGKDVVQPVKRRFVLNAKSFVNAICEMASIIELNYGHRINFRWSWQSSLGDCLWLAVGENNDG